VEKVLNKKTNQPVPAIGTKKQMCCKNAKLNETSKENPAY
tara:strand:+ start:373 stop:492 length:120 start_codon:yes stop_codon:yes gene_type:complete